MNPSLSTRQSTTSTNSNSALTRAYGPSASNAVSLGLIHRHQLHSASSANTLFNLGHYNECADLCLEILSSSRPPAEAIQARCHMYLSMDGVGYAEDDEEELNDKGRLRAAKLRLKHAERAVQLWDIVVDRRGESRFPVQKAKGEREEAKALVEAAKAGVVEAEAQYPDETGRDSAGPTREDDDGSEDGEIIPKHKSPYFHIS